MVATQCNKLKSKRTVRLYTFTHWYKFETIPPKNSLFRHTARWPTKTCWFCKASKSCVTEGMVPSMFQCAPVHTCLHNWQLSIEVSVWFSLRHLFIWIDNLFILKPSSNFQITLSRNQSSADGWLISAELWRVYNFPRAHMWLLDFIRKTTSKFLIKSRGHDTGKFTIIHGL